MTTDKRFGKPLCSKFIPSGKQCGFPVYKDSVCKRHHEDWQYSKAHNEETNEQEIDNAIILLVKNGYRVDKPN